MEADSRKIGRQTEEIMKTYSMKPDRRKIGGRQKREWRQIAGSMEADRQKIGGRQKRELRQIAERM